LLPGPEFQIAPSQETQLPPLPFGPSPMLPLSGTRRDGGLQSDKELAFTVGFGFGFGFGLKNLIKL